MIPDLHWHWRNCRSIAVCLGFAPLNWAIRYEKRDDVYEWSREVQIGPFAMILSADHGNCSSKNRFEAWLGLSESETYARAMKYEGRTHDR